MTDFYTGCLNISQCHQQSCELLISQWTCAGLKGTVFVPIWSGIGYGFQGNYENICIIIISFQFQMNKKVREICKFKTGFNNSILLAF